MVSRNIFFYLFAFWLLQKCRESNKLNWSAHLHLLLLLFSGSMDMMDLSLNHLALRYVYVGIDSGAFFGLFACLKSA